ncbi:uncharacterized protein [Branchiostoma lanceolatum]|uniref:uncharacterized protein n=1 Tax=Branchiostoma lanceolatum TaxID=7740 RepID=UPI0034513C9D
MLLTYIQTHRTAGSTKNIIFPSSSVKITTVTPSTASGTTVPTTPSETTVTPSTASGTTVPTTPSETTVTPSTASGTTTPTIPSNTARTTDHQATWGRTSTETPSSNEGCLDDLYRCKGGGKCIDFEKVCDGTPDCPEEDDEKLFCGKGSGTSIPVVPIAAGVGSAVALCVIVAGIVFFLKKRRRRSQATTQDVHVNNPEHTAEVANPLKKGNDLPAKPRNLPRDSHIYAAINPQDMDNNFTVSTENPEGTNTRPDTRHNNNAYTVQAPRDSNYATPDDLRGTIYENIPDEIPEESPYQALDPDTMENAQYTSLSEVAKKK